MSPMALNPLLATRSPSELHCMMQKLQFPMEDIPKVKTSQAELLRPYKFEDTTSPDHNRMTVSKDGSGKWK
jgi:hypothetical protein